MDDPKAALRDILRLLERGEHDTARRYAQLVLEGLTAAKPRRSVNSEQMLSDAHRAALSKSRATRDKKFLASLRAAGYTLNSLAEAVKMSPAALSQARRSKSDDNHRPIRQGKAEEIERLIGWPATDWPEIIKG